MMVVVVRLVIVLGSAMDFGTGDVRGSCGGLFKTGST